MNIIGDAAFLNGNTIVWMAGDPLVGTGASLLIDKEKVGNTGVVRWGENNNFPSDIAKVVEDSIDLSAFIDFLVKSSYGQGLEYGIWTLDELKNEWVLKLINDPEIDLFFKKMNVQALVMDILKNFYTFWNVFPQFVMSKDRTKICTLAITQAKTCRYEAPDKYNSQLKKNILLNPNWENGNAKSPETLPVKCYDSNTYDLVSQIAIDKPRNFIVPITYSSVGRDFYQLAPWDGVRTSGWLEIVRNIPLYKKYLMQNQMVIKYHITIPSIYWEQLSQQRYSKDLKELTTDERDKMRVDALEPIQKKLTDIQNTGNTIITTEYTELHGTANWSIKAIDDKMKDGAYIQDSQEGSAALMRAMGLDATLLGPVPGKSQGAGSGSDKYAAMDIHQQLNKPIADMAVQPFMLMLEYNGFTKRLPNLGVRLRPHKLNLVADGKQTIKQGNRKNNGTTNNN